MAATRPRSPSAVSASAVLDRPLRLLGGLSPAGFMKRHWQKRPLLVRGAVALPAAPLDRRALFSLAAREEVESRVIRRPVTGDPRWQLRHGPFRRGDLPGVREPDWTVLVQGVNLHVPAADALMAQFRFIPDARLDDLMVSWASEGGGVGPHFDSYDVFLIQVEGRRRWRIGRMPEARLVPDQPIKLIDGFVHEQEWILEPGDMLYLPPLWAHDGDAVGGACMTCSVGFRAPREDELAHQLLLRLAEAQEDRMLDADEAACEAAPGSAAPAQLYGDARQAPTTEPARVPLALARFARTALLESLREPGALERALGEYLSEPKASVRFRRGVAWRPGAGVRLHARTRMLYDEGHVFINGASLLAAGRDARVLRMLADRRLLGSGALQAASADLQEALRDWTRCGWLVSVPDGGNPSD